MKKYLEALFTVIIFSSILPHELGHFFTRRLLGMSAESLTIGNPYQKPLVTLGWFNIGKMNIDIEGMVKSKPQDVPNWKRILVYFAGVFMDLVSALLVIYACRYLVDFLYNPITLYVSVLILLLGVKFLFSAVWNMIPIRKITNNVEALHDGLQIKKISRFVWSFTMLITLTVAGYILYHLVKLTMVIIELIQLI